MSPMPALVEPRMRTEKTKKSTAGGSGGALYTNPGMARDREVFLDDDGEATDHDDEDPFTDDLTDDLDPDLRGSSQLRRGLKSSS